LKIFENSNAARRLDTGGGSRKRSMGHSNYIYGTWNEVESRQENFIKMQKSFYET